MRRLDKSEIRRNARESGCVVLYHGDCLDWMGSVGDRSVDLIAADLPYGTTACEWDAVIPFEPLWTHYARVIKPGGSIVLTASQPFTSALVMSRPRWFRHRWAWIRGERKTGFWDAKRRPLRTFEDVLVFGLSEGLYVPQMETGIPYTATQGRKLAGVYRERRRGEIRVAHKNVTSRFPTDVLVFDPDDPRRRFHRTQKPVALMEYLIRTYSLPGDLVLDNTMGSGTTGVACVNLSRRFVGIEKDRDIFNVAQRRITNAQKDRDSRLLR